MNPERLMQIILSPVVSEKATLLADNQRQFVFKVAKDATKSEIKAAIEFLFKVQVASVRICNVKGKKKMLRRKPGQRAHWKKAYVALKEGFDINFVGEKG